MAANYRGLDQYVVREWSRRLAETTIPDSKELIARAKAEYEMAVHQATARTFHVQRAKHIEVVEPEDPELRPLKAQSLTDRALARATAYGLKVDGSATHHAMLTMIGMLLQEIDDLRAIVESR